MLTMQEPQPSEIKADIWTLFGTGGAFLSSVSIFLYCVVVIDNIFNLNIDNNSTSNTTCNSTQDSSSALGFSSLGAIIAALPSFIFCLAFTYLKYIQNLQNQDENKVLAINEENTLIQDESPIELTKDDLNIADEQPSKLNLKVLGIRTIWGIGATAQAMKHIGQITFLINNTELIRCQSSLIRIALNLALLGYGSLGVGADNRTFLKNIEQHYNIQNNAPIESDVEKSDWLTTIGFYSELREGFTDNFTFWGGIFEDLNRLLFHLPKIWINLSFFGLGGGFIPCLLISVCSAYCHSRYNILHQISSNELQAKLSNTKNNIPLSGFQKSVLGGDGLGHGAEFVSSIVFLISLGLTVAKFNPGISLLIKVSIFVVGMIAAISDMRICRQALLQYNILSQNKKIEDHKNYCNFFRLPCFEKLNITLKPKQDFENADVTDEQNCFTQLLSSRKT